MVASMKGEVTTTVEMAPSALGAALSAVRLCAPDALEGMRVSLSKLGQLTAVQAYRVGTELEVFDGLKRRSAVLALGWPTVRVEVHALDAAGAKVRVLGCNASAPLSVLEEAWLVRSLYRDDALTQPQIAVLLGRHKSWVCRRLVLAEGVSDELTANVRLGLISATAVRELSRLPRGNQDEVARIVARRGLTTRQTGSLVDAVMASSPGDRARLLEEASKVSPPAPKGGPSRRTPGEQLVADAWAMKRLSARLHVRLLERSLESLGDEACVTVSRELGELRSALHALTRTLETRLTAQGATHAAG